MFLLFEQVNKFCLKHEIFWCFRVEKKRINWLKFTKISGKCADSSSSSFLPPQKYRYFLGKEILWLALVKSQRKSQRFNKSTSIIIVKNGKMSICSKTGATPLLFVLFLFAQRLFEECHPLYSSQRVIVPLLQTIPLLWSHPLLLKNLWSSFPISPGTVLHPYVFRAYRFLNIF